MSTSLLPKNGHPKEITFFDLRARNILSPCGADKSILDFRFINPFPFQTSIFFQTSKIGIQLARAGTHTGQSCRARANTRPYGYGHGLIDVRHSFYV